MEWKEKISTFRQIDVRGVQGNFFQGLKKQAMQLPAGEGLEIVQSFEPIPLTSASDRAFPGAFYAYLLRTNEAENC